MILYCITHEEWFHGTEEDLGDNSDVGGCLVSTSAPPDEFDRDGWEFIMSLPEPSPEELERMNLNARELEMDFS